MDVSQCTCHHGDTTWPIDGSVISWHQLFIEQALLLDAHWNHLAQPRWSDIITSLSLSVLRDQVSCDSASHDVADYNQVNSPINASCLHMECLRPIPCLVGALFWPPTAALHRAVTRTDRTCTDWDWLESLARWAVTTNLPFTVLWRHVMYTSRHTRRVNRPLHWAQLRSSPRPILRYAFEVVSFCVYYIC